MEARVSLMMIVDAVKCGLMMIGRDTNRVRGERASVRRNSAAGGVQEHR